MRTVFDGFGAVREAIVTGKSYRVPSGESAGIKVWIVIILAALEGRFFIASRFAYRKLYRL